MLFRSLDIIKRANIKFDKYSDLTTSFKLAGIPTYTELIMGLPGETLETFKNGLENIAKTKIGNVFIYNCSVLPNAPMNVPEYRQKYKIETVHSPIMLAHSSIHNRGIQEYEEIVVSSFSCSLEDLKEMFLYSWAFLNLQSLGILKHIADYYNQKYDLPFMKFYQTMLEFSRVEESIFSEEVSKIIEYIDNGYAGKGWDHHDPNLGDINWQIEEASWLRLTYDKNHLQSSIGTLLSFIENKFNYSSPRSEEHTSELQSH